MKNLSKKSHEITELAFVEYDGFGPETFCDKSVSLVAFLGVGGVRKLPSLCIIHLAGIGGRKGVRRRAVSPCPLLLLGVVCMTANVGLENSIMIIHNKQKRR